MRFASRSSTAPPRNARLSNGSTRSSYLPPNPTSFNTQPFTRQTQGKTFPFAFSQAQPIYARSLAPLQDSSSVKIVRALLYLSRRIHLPSLPFKFLRLTLRRSPLSSPRYSPPSVFHLLQMAPLTTGRKLARIGSPTSTSRSVLIITQLESQPLMNPE